MATRPAGLTYHVDERPPAHLIFLLGLQHTFTMSSMLILPVIIVQEIGGSYLEVKSAVSFSMIAAGLGTILQAINKGPVGSGYLCPNICGPSFLSVSLEAGWLGGLPLIHGMIMLAGLTECLFSRVIHKLKKLFPPEITGLVVFMVGVGLIPLGVSKFFGVEYSGESIDPKELFVACFTLLLMIGLNIWGKGKLRLYGVLIGITAGFVLASVFGLISSSEIKLISDTPLFSLPGKRGQLFKYSFNVSLIIPFVLVSIVQSLKTFGNLTTCQKINDAEWKEADMKNIGKGLLADGISVFLGGSLGGGGNRLFSQ